MVSVCHASKCRKRGAPELARLLNDEVAAHGLEGCVKVRRGGCNDLCSRAPTMAVQPDRIWYAEMTPEAVGLVVSKHLSGGKPVRRWVAKDKGARGEKAGKKTKKAEKRAAKLQKKLRKADKKVAKAERRALKHARAITVPDVTEAGVAM